MKTKQHYIPKTLIKRYFRLQKGQSISFFDDQSKTYKASNIGKIRQMDNLYDLSNDFLNKFPSLNSKSIEDHFSKVENKISWAIDSIQKENYTYFGIALLYFKINHILQSRHPYFLKFFSPKYSPRENYESIELAQKAISNFANKTVGSQLGEEYVWLMVSEQGREMLKKRSQKYLHHMTNKFFVWNFQEEMPMSDLPCVMVNFFEKGKKQNETIHMRSTPIKDRPLFLMINSKTWILFSRESKNVFFPDDFLLETNASKEFSDQEKLEIASITETDYGVWQVPLEISEKIKYAMIQGGCLHVTSKNHGVLTNKILFEEIWPNNVFDNKAIIIKDSEELKFTKGYWEKIISKMRDQSIESKEFMHDKKMEDVIEEINKFESGFKS